MKKFLIVLAMVVTASLLMGAGCFDDTQPDLYTLTMEVNPSGGGTTVPAIGVHPNYTAGAVENITATPTAGYEFVYWIGGVTGTDNPTTVIMDSDKTVIAHFEAIGEPEEPTVAPIITSVPDVVGGYINAVAAADGIVVHGTAPTLSEVKVYINGLTAGTGDVTATGFWTVDVANADLIKAVKTDGEKVLYAKATDIGKLESVSSNEVKFTLDTKLPTIDECSAKAGTKSVTGSAVATPTVLLQTCVLQIPLGWITQADVVSGVWTVDVITQLGTFDLWRVRITDPDGLQTEYAWIPGLHVFPKNAPIPGVRFMLRPFGFLKVGQQSKITCTAAAPAVPGYIDVTFNEPVTGASILAGTWTAYGATVNLMPVVTVRSATEARLTEGNPGQMKAGQAYSVSCSGPTDLAGNSILASSPETCTGVVMP